MPCGRLRAGMIVSSLLLAATSSPTGGGRAMAGDPVDLATGLNVRENSDIVVSGEPKIELNRTFGAGWGTRSRAFGIATSHPFDVFLVAAGNEEATTETKRIDLVLPDGGRIPFVRTSPGTGHTGAVLMHAGSPSAFHGSRLRWTDPGWELDLVNGSRYTFPACGAGAVRAEQCALIGYRDGQGRSLSFDRDANGNLRRVSSGWFRGINFRYDSAHRIVRADTGWGLSMTTVDYAYDAGGGLASVKSRQVSLWTLLFGLIYAYQSGTLPSLDLIAIRYNAEYTYDEQHRLRLVKEPGLELDHEYDAAGRVIKQHVKGWGSWTFTYTPGADGKVAQTDVVDPDGLHRRVVFHADGYPQSDTMSPGRPEERVTRFEHEPGGNIVARITVECRSASGAPATVTAPVGSESADIVEERLHDQCGHQREAASTR